MSQNIILTQAEIDHKIKRIAPLEVSLCEERLNKQQPHLPVTTSMAAKDYENKGLVLVDDVLNSGSTLVYGVKHFLEVPLGKFKTAVLIDRNHKKYPVKADFKGISLSTSMQEHVQVVFAESGDYACLTY